jgi:peroxiredoxin Q/BCP
MLKVGDTAPAFAGRSADGRTVKLADLRGRKVVLYFFPRAFTPGCTVETRGFRDHYQEIVDLGAEVIGVSVDSHERQCEFAGKEGVSFPMLGDPTRQIGKDYKTLWPLLSVNQRVTYIIDEQGRIEAVFHHELQVGKHLSQVREHLKKARASPA